MRPGPAEPPLPAADARRLWRRMTEVYGHRWTAQYGPEPAPGRSHPTLATWARGLAGVGPAGLARGLERVVQAGGPWPPALPEFREMCRARPGDFGLPAPQAALEEAARARRTGRPGAWSHPAVGLAAESAFRMPFATGLERERAFLRAYRHLTARVVAGRPLAPLPAEALGPPPEPPASPAEARRHLAALKAVVGLAPEGDWP